LTRDRRWEVAGFFLLFGSLGLDLGFDVGIAGFLLGTGSDGEELVESQDARFAATVAFLTFVEDGKASYWCVSGVAYV
jgi:hypothetical protein